MILDTILNGILMIFDITQNTRYSLQLITTAVKS